MIRVFIGTAVAAVLIAFTAPGPAQARMANPGLSAEVPNLTQDVQYRRHRGYYRHRGYRHRSYRRSRHCWNQRVRVRVPGGYFVWRTHRRCGWR